MKPNALWTPSVQRGILALIRQGSPPSIAAVACGVREDAFLEWMRAYDGFRRQVAKAQAAFEQEMLNVIRKAAADGNPKAVAWLRDHPHAGIQ